jgi:lipoate-protein ligase A
MTWEVVRRREAARTVHGRALPEPAARAVWVSEPTGPALVLGSSQRDGVADAAACAAAGVEVVRRRSGGGAVLVRPGDLLWVDVILPVGDDLWDDDVGLASHWLGAAWSDALAGLGVATTVHRGAMQRPPWSDLVCFAGLGPGEVTRPDGAKLVGTSQRRTRAAARFQCAALARWAPEELVALLALSAADREQATHDLAGSAAGVGVDLDVLLTAFLDALP